MITATTPKRRSLASSTRSLVASSLIAVNIPDGTPVLNVRVTMPAASWTLLEAVTDWSELATNIGLIAYDAAAISALRANPQYTNSVYLPATVVNTILAQGREITKDQPLAEHGLPVPPAPYAGDILALALVYVPAP